MILDRGCFERGCACYDDRVDKDGIEVVKKEWVGLDGEIPGLGLVTEEFYNGMLFAEDILRGKNGG